MDMTGECRIAAPPGTVWEALNDPDILRRSIPGCEELEKRSDTEFAAKVRARVGPVNAKFAGNVHLSNVNPPSSYTIAGEGKGGAAGFAKGSADVSLREDGDGTVLSYTVKATVGGKLAQIGSRMVDGAARKMADDFFARFKAQLEPEVAPAAAPAEAPPEAPAPPAARRALGPWVWIAGVIALVIILLAIFGAGG